MTHNVLTHKLVKALCQLLIVAQILYLTLFVGSAYPVQAATLTVNTNADGGDSNVGDGICDDGTGQCSLRAAIQQANANPGTDTINFNIGFGVQTIAPASSLPTITNPVIIDGTTQPGFSSTPIIELNGVNAGGGGTNGLKIVVSNNTVRGLVINRFEVGIRIESGDSNVIEGNFIGTDVAGTTVRRNSAYDVLIIDSASNRIGGLTSGARNIISGSGAHGIGIFGSTNDSGLTRENTVQGNYIGTDVTGSAALGNLGSGIIIGNGINTTVGGTATGAGNVISGNGDGVEIYSDGSTGNIVQGNHIGTNATGTAGLANIVAGVVLRTGSSGSMIGGTASGAGNVFAFNSGPGVRINSSIANAVLSNAIFSNGGKGIQLLSGGNNLQTFPTLTSALSGAADTTIQGTLTSAANTTYRLDSSPTLPAIRPVLGRGRLS